MCYHTEYWFYKIVLVTGKYHSVLSHCFLFYKAVLVTGEYDTAVAQWVRAFASHAEGWVRITAATDLSRKYM